MNTRTLINKLILLSFFVIAGYLLARSMYYRSVMGVLCALVGIAAWIRFLYQFSAAQTDQNEDRNAEMDY